MRLMQQGLGACSLRIRSEVLNGQRASYGEEIVATLSRQLVADYGHSFEEKNLRWVTAPTRR